MRVYVLYHAHCYDGYASAWAARYHFQDKNVTYQAVNYGQPPPPLELGSRVYIADFSYPKEQLLALADAGHRVTVLDHHKTAQDALAGLEHPNLEIVFDMQRSGARITWDYFHGNKDDVPWLIRLIESRDLWRFDVRGAAEVHTYLQSQPFDFDVWDGIHETLEAPTGREAIISSGATLIRFRDQQVEQQCTQARIMTLAGFVVPVVNATCMWSEIGNKLLELHPDQPFAVSWFQQQDGQVKLSLRSRKDFDCSAVAKLLGGGGHAQAAGATVGWDAWNSVTHSAGVD